VEIEIKLDASEVSEESVFALFGITEVKEKTMSAVYYDDAEGTLGKNGIALRLRRENGEGIVTLKRRMHDAEGFSRRGEWECPADDIASGLAGIDTEDEGTNAIVRSAAQRGLVPIAQMDFTRKYAALKLDGSEIELAFDRGLFNRRTPFCETELELKSGTEEVLTSAAERLEGELGMKPQPLSKLARALRE